MSVSTGARVLKAFRIGPQGIAAVQHRADLWGVSWSAALRRMLTWAAVNMPDSSETTGDQGQ